MVFSWEGTRVNLEHGGVERVFRVKVEYLAVDFPNATRNVSLLRTVLVLLANCQSPILLSVG